MRIVFKVIAIVGVLSFLGGLKSGVFFFFGLILAAIFGYFGWRPEKKMEQEQSPRPAVPLKKITTTSINEHSSNKYSTINEGVKSNNELSESELEKQIETTIQRKELLIRTYNDGLFNSKEYDQKISELEAEISKLNQLLTLKLTTNKVLLENKNLFDSLLELKAQELITSEEYKFKYNELLSSILQKIELQNAEEEKDLHQEFYGPDRLVHQEIARDRTKTYSLLGFSLLLVVTISIIIFQYSSNKSHSNSSNNVSNTQVNKSNSGDEITKDTLHSDKIEIDRSNKIVETDSKTTLDSIYLGTNLFDYGFDGTWGRATISKKSDHYWIKGEHNMSNGDWVKIEGEILDPSLEGFTFDGKIIVYSPTEAQSFNENNHLRDFYKVDRNKIIGDTCIWEGITTAYKLFQERKYWRIKVPNYCYSYTGDIDIFHN